MVDYYLILWTLNGTKHRKEYQTESGARNHVAKVAREHKTATIRLYSVEKPIDNRAAFTELDIASAVDVAHSQPSRRQFWNERNRRFR